MAVTGKGKFYFIRQLLECVLYSASKQFGLLLLALLFSLCHVLICFECVHIWFLHRIDISNEINIHLIVPI